MNSVKTSPCFSDKVFSEKAYNYSPSGDAVFSVFSPRKNRLPVDSRRGRQRHSRLRMPAKKMLRGIGHIKPID